MLQAENDIRCPAGQTDMVFLILRVLGRRVEMVRYPGESHLMLMVGGRTGAWIASTGPSGGSRSTCCPADYARVSSSAARR